MKFEFDTSYNQRVAEAPSEEFSAILDSVANRHDVMWKSGATVTKIKMGLTEKQAKDLAKNLNLVLSGKKKNGRF